MNRSRLYFVGTPDEIAHHASPLMEPLADFVPSVVAPNEVVAIAQPGDVAVFYSEHFERFRSAIDQLKNNSVATLYMIDGVLEWRNAWENQPNEVACPHTMRPVLCHKVACIGESQARTINAWGNESKVEIVGVPRFDRYQSVEHCYRSVENPGQQTDSLNSTLRVMVITAKTPAFTMEKLATVKRALLDLKTFAESSSDQIQLRWRLTAGLDKFLDVNNHAADLTGGELFRQLQEVDAVIATPSTSVIEAMLAGRPTAVLNYHVCPTYLSPAWQINGPDQIASVIRELRNPPEAKLHFQRQALAQALSRKSSATEAMVCLIRNMANLARKQTAAGQPLVFPNSMLKTPAPQPAALDHVRLFPDDEAFQQSDILELQALLSNARRHINHQAERISQLESELTDAHNIFDQINTHPLAGPVIRLRERILKVLSVGARNEVLLDDSNPNPPQDSQFPTV